ncbi:MAG: hypothetical protein K2M00_05745 [Muribaculaceae bacterium]|nr:hypothetical protein [Muribaculaceae bacterium]
MKISRYLSFLLLLPAIIFTSCEDIIPYDPVIIGEGEATISGELQFHPLEPALESRTPGNAIDKINQLWMVIYKVDASGEKVESCDKVLLYGMVEI